MWTVATMVARRVEMRCWFSAVALLCGLVSFFGSTHRVAAQAALVGGEGYLTSSGCYDYDEAGNMYSVPCAESPGPNPGPGIDLIAGKRIGQMVQQAQLTRLLLGSYEQINCTNTCISAFGAVGSFSAGFHGRKYVTQRLSLIGGVSFNNVGSGSVTTRQAIIGALGVRYDFVDWGSSRPFF